MGEKYKWKTKWCNICEMEVQNKKQHYETEHPEYIWKKVKKMKEKYETEIKDLVTAGTLECLFEEPDYLFRVFKDKPEVELEDKTKIKVDTIYYFKYKKK